jgi:hypothetical protein
MILMIVVIVSAVVIRSETVEQEELLAELWQLVISVEQLVVVPTKQYH